MKPWKMLAFGCLAALALTARGSAQDIPGIPGAAGAAAGPAAAAGPNLFTMLLPPPEMRERCRQKLCKCEIVKMLRNAMTPMSMATGGLIGKGNCCPDVKKEDLLKPADSSEGAAAAIKKTVEEAAARREAVRYLGTVDCRYFPEAEDALINHLRADPIECVRYEAALALQRGCCCSKKTVKALTEVVEGKDTPHPAERSQRVIDAAVVALSMCVLEDKNEKKKEAEKKDEKKLVQVSPAEHYRAAEKLSNDELVASARTALAKRGITQSSQMLAHPHRAASQGLFGMMTQASNASREVPPTQTREPARTVVAQAPVPAPAPRRGLIYKVFGGEESATVETPIAAPTNTNVRQTTWVSAPTPTPAPAVPTTLPAREPSLGYSTLTAPAPMATPPTTSSASRTDNSSLGFVIFDDAPARKR